MNLKTIITTLFCTTLIHSMAFAGNLPASEFNFNGARLWESMKTVIQQHGNPLKTIDTVSTSPEGHQTPVRIFFYGPDQEGNVDNLGIRITATSMGSEITHIETKHDGVTTPAGIHVGSTEKAVQKAYGKPDGIFPKGEITYYGYLSPVRPHDRLFLGIQNQHVVSMTLTKNDVGFASHPLYGSQTFVIGGLLYSSTMDNVRSIYGTPTSHTTETFKTRYHTYLTNDIYWYGDSVKITSRNNHLLSLDVFANNGWTAPGGIAVGDSVQKLITTCGFPSFVKTRGNTTYYTYVYANIVMGFDIQNGMITSMGLGSGGD